MIANHKSHDEDSKPGWSADATSFSMKKSKSVDLGKLRRQMIDQCASANRAALHGASKFSHDVVFGCYALRQSSSRGDLRAKGANQIDCDTAGAECLCSSSVSTEPESETFEDDVIMTVVDRRKWTVGRVSLFMLVLFTFTDVIFHVVNAQMQALDSPDHYDALSADVIRPAFRYHSTNVDRIPDKPRLGLGSAAISSVTTALSPILPFTGGLDLRREDYWTNGWFGSVSSVAQQVRDAFQMDKSPKSRPSITVARGGGQVAVQDSRTGASKVPITHELSLSDSEPFVPVEQIADLTLRDVSMAFRYAVESTRDDFDRSKFFQGVVPRVTKVLGAMTNAASKSAGKAVNFAVTSGGPSAPAGDIDALHFCAAMRIFAEWRLLRQVPDGYKGYAVGMSLGHKDVVQNVGKIEQATHSWIDHHHDHLMQDGACEGGACDVRSPTLRDLLDFEIEMNVHDNTKLPRLKERTAAMGLLWARRQLQYQTAIFVNALQVPKVYESTKAAVSAAYSEIYDKYHGWAVQKIFNYSFQAAPDASEVYKTMNPQRLQEVQALARTQAGSTNANDMRHFSRSGKDEDANPVEKFSKHIGREWAKVTGFVGVLFGDKHANRKADAERVETIPVELQEAQIEEFVVREMTKDAHENIRDYLTVANPLLKDLSILFDELNMDDPTKV